MVKGVRAEPGNCLVKKCKFGARITAGFNRARVRDAFVNGCGPRRSVRRKQINFADELSETGVVFGVSGEAKAGRRNEKAENEDWKRKGAAKHVFA
jgi:hypothetical protein